MCEHLKLKAYIPFIFILFGKDFWIIEINIIVEFIFFVQVLQEVLRFYGVPEESFGRVCIVIDKVS